MQKRTATKQISEAISNNLLRITKAEVYHKTSRKTEPMDADIFQENLDFLSESGCFADAIGWHYEWDHKINNYEIESGRMNPNTDLIIIARLCACDGVSNEDIEQALLFSED